MRRLQPHQQDRLESLPLLQRHSLLSEMVDHAERTELDIKLLHEDVLALDPEDRADLADRMDKLVEGRNGAARQLMAFVDRVATQLGIQDEAR